MFVLLEQIKFYFLLYSGSIIIKLFTFARIRRNDVFLILYDKTRVASDSIQFLRRRPHLHNYWLTKKE